MFEATIWCSTCSRSGSGATGMLSSRRAKPASALMWVSTARAAEVLDQVVVDVHAVHGRPGGVDLVEVIEIVVDEVG